MKCSRCGGSIVEKKCISCGEELPNPTAKGKFIKANAQEIADDYITMGSTRVCLKWGFGTAALYRIPEVRKAMGQPRGDGLPLFPVWSNEWATEVQLKWLEIWEKQKEAIK